MTKDPEPCLMSLYRDAGGEEDTDSQADVAEALQHVVDSQGVEGVVLEGYGAHGQAAEEENQVSQAEEE